MSSSVRQRLLVWRVVVTCVHGNLNQSGNLPCWLFQALSNSITCLCFTLHWMYLKIELSCDYYKVEWWVGLSFFRFFSFKVTCRLSKSAISLLSPSVLYSEVNRQSLETDSHRFEGSILASEEGKCKLVENKLIGTKLLPFVCGVVWHSPLRVVLGFWTGWSCGVVSLVLDDCFQ